MKTTLKLENIQKAKSGMEFVSIDAEMVILDKTLTVKLNCTSIAVRIMSDHLVHEMAAICECLDTGEVRLFVKDILKANEVLKQTRTI